MRTIRHTWRDVLVVDCGTYVVLNGYVWGEKGGDDDVIGEVDVNRIGVDKVGGRMTFLFYNYRPRYMYY